MSFQAFIVNRHQFFLGKPGSSLCWFWPFFGLIICFIFHFLLWLIYLFTDFLQSLLSFFPENIFEKMICTKSFILNHQPMCLFYFVWPNVASSSEKRWNQITWLSCNKTSQFWIGNIVWLAFREQDWISLFIWSTSIECRLQRLLNPQQPANQQYKST